MKSILNKSGITHVLPKFDYKMLTWNMREWDIAEFMSDIQNSIADPTENSSCIFDDVDVFLVCHYYGAHR